MDQANSSPRWLHVPCPRRSLINLPTDVRERQAPPACQSAEAQKWAAVCWRHGDERHLQSSATRDGKKTDGKKNGRDDAGPAEHSSQSPIRHPEWSQRRCVLLSDREEREVNLKWRRHEGSPALAMPRVARGRRRWLHSALETNPSTTCCRITCAADSGSRPQLEKETPSPDSADVFSFKTTRPTRLLRAHPLFCFFPFSPSPTLVRPRILEVPAIACTNTTVPAARR